MSVEVRSEKPKMSGAHLEALRQYNLQESPAIAEDEKANKELRERMFGIPADLIQAPFVTICSVWPKRMVSQAFCHNGLGLKRYTIEPGSSQNPSYLLLQNAWTWVTGEEEKMAVPTQKPIGAAHYASDIIRFWTGDQPGNKVGKIGIGIIHGERTGDPNNPITAKKSEIDELCRLQEAILAYRVEEADKNWDNGKREKAATESNREAVRILGLDISQHPWYRSKIQLYNSCPECAEKVMVDAVRCKHCQSDLWRMHKDGMIALDLDQWPGINKRLRAIKNLQDKNKEKANA